MEKESTTKKSSERHRALSDIEIKQKTKELMGKFKCALTTIPEFTSKVAELYFKNSQNIDEKLGEKVIIFSRGLASNPDRFTVEYHKNSTTEKIIISSTNIYTFSGVALTINEQKSDISYWRDPSIFPLQANLRNNTSAVKGAEKMLLRLKQPSPTTNSR